MKRYLLAFLKVIGYGFAILNLQGVVVPAQRSRNWNVISGITWNIVLENVMVLVLVMTCYFALIQAIPGMKWSWWSLLMKKDRKDEEEESGEKLEGEELEGWNIHLLPNLKLLGLYLPILAFCIPSLVTIEERIFRQGINTREEGILMSLIFGMVHCLSGVPIAAGLSISIAGLWFTHQYFNGGIERAIVHHTAYDIVVLFTVTMLLLVHFVANVANKIKRKGG
jgi:hypothetical protein